MLMNTDVVCKLVSDIIKWIAVNSE